MPSAKRFAFLRETVRNHPVVVATTAATAAFCWADSSPLQLLAPPQKRKPMAQAPPQVSRRNQGYCRNRLPRRTVPPHPAPASPQPTAISRPGLTFRVPAWTKCRRKNGGPRVVSTDKLDQPTVTAIEAQPPRRRPRQSPRLVLPIEPGRRLPTAPPAVRPTPVGRRSAPVAAPSRAPAVATRRRSGRRSRPRRRVAKSAEAKRGQGNAAPAVKSDGRRGKPQVAKHEITTTDSLG